MSASGVGFCPPSLEPEADAETAIDEEEYLNDALLKSPPTAEEAAYSHQSQTNNDEASHRRAISARISGLGTPALPASCRVKRLGTAPASGISGAVSVRAPLNRLVWEAARRRLRGGTGRAAAPPLPLARLDVFQHGLGISDDAFFPIETVSYAAMDTRMPRMFCFVSVEIANGGCSPVNPTCHAFLCATVEACYRLVLAVTAAFNSAVNRSKAVSRRRSVARATAATAAGGARDADKAASHRIVNLAFTGDHEEA